MLLLSLENFAAFLQMRVFFTVFILFWAYAVGLPHLGQTHTTLLAYMAPSALTIPAGSPGFACLDVLGHDVAALDDDLALLGG